MTDVESMLAKLVKRTKMICRWPWRYVKSGRAAIHAAVLDLQDGFRGGRMGSRTPKSNENAILPVLICVSVPYIGRKRAFCNCSQLPLASDGTQGRHLIMSKNWQHVLPPSSPKPMLRRNEIVRKM